MSHEYDPHPANAAPDSGYFVGVEVGAAIIRAGVFTSSLQLVGKTKFSTKIERGPAAVIERIARCIRYAADECDLPMSKIIGCGIGVPGHVDRHSGIVRISSDLGWENVSVAGELERELGLPVFAGQLYDFATLGILSHEVQPVPRTFAAIFLGAQIGAGLVRDDGLVDLSTLACEFEQPEQNVLLTMPGGQFRHFRSRDFRKAVRKDNQLVRMFLREVAANAGRLAARLATACQPDLIALGGSVLDELREEIVQIVETNCRQELGQRSDVHVKLMASALGDLAGMAGASAWVSRKIAPRFQQGGLPLAPA